MDGLCPPKRGTAKKNEDIQNAGRFNVRPIHTLLELKGPLLKRGIDISVFKKCLSLEIILQKTTTSELSYCAVQKEHNPVMKKKNLKFGMGARPNHNSQESDFILQDLCYAYKHSCKIKMFYLIELCAGRLPFPTLRAPWTRWALLHEESPKNQPLFDHEAALQLFNLTGTFRRESSFPITLQHLHSLEALTDTEEWLPGEIKSDLLESGELAPIMYIQSDCDTPAQRDTFVEELQKYIQIDSYGTCLHNRDLPSHLLDSAESHNHADLRSLTARYMFTLAVENAQCDDYITEKLWRPLTVGSVPVYWGSPSIHDWLPNKNSIVDVRDFKDPLELAKFLYKIIQNDTLYDSYLEHKTYGVITNDLLYNTMESRQWGIDNDFLRGNFIEHFECYVCDKVISEHSSTKPGKLKATRAHYGCPEPPSAPNGNVDNSSFWVEQWHKARVEASLLHHLLSNPPYTFIPDDFYDQVLIELQKNGYFQRFPPEHVEL
ncbi:unnamed protein product, partial [Meganyctiphanes norvegica]